MAEKTKEEKTVDMTNAFDVLRRVNVNEHVEVKDTGKTQLKYLSWPFAWSEVKRRYPDANYEIIKFDGLPYVYDEKTGYMVYTAVTIDGITHEMWLPVMDGQNRAMLAHPYEVQTKYSKFTVQAATMFDINKTLMRCLVKNLAMFGLGLYVYAGEDLPDEPDNDTAEPKTENKSSSKKKKAEPESVPSPVTEPVPEPTEEDRDAFNRLQKYIKDNKLNANEIASACRLSKLSRKADFESALEYARTINMIGGEV